MLAPAEIILASASTRYRPRRRSGIADLAKEAKMGNPAPEKVVAPYFGKAAGIGPAKCNADNAVTIFHPESGFVVNVELPRRTALMKP
jgi:hypothetical protein